MRLNEARVGDQKDARLVQFEKKVGPFDGEPFEDLSWVRNVQPIRGSKQT